MNNKIIIKLQGGLGNQMFQYALANVLAQKNNAKVYLDNSFFSLKKKRVGFTPRNFELGVFNNTYSEISSKDLSLFFKLSFFNRVKKKFNLNYPKIYNEVVFGFNQPVLDLKTPVYLNGYFQSTKYFITHEKLIKELFTFKINHLDTLNKEIMEKISETNSIGVHIRRGDYIEDKVTQKFHGNCNIEYYFKGIELLEKLYEDFTLVFFSDDIEWVKEQFGDLPYSKIFVDHNKNENSWKDMCLMSFCNHNIIANSSFSWWGAWLNKNDSKIVIAPKKWFDTKGLDTTTLLPKEWIQI